jgi:glycosyltransferase involved in cell wall biosynthesis
MTNKNLKILEICPYSAGGCGVWARVKQEANELVKKGYRVKVFSSYFEKGTDKIMPKLETLNGFEIRRFPARKLGGESFMKWDFTKEALEYSPDIIIAHNYRHFHTTKALNVAEMLRKKGKKVKIFLVTHAPFVEGNITRSRFATLIVNFYDRFVGPKTLNRFDKILTISHWEVPYLIKAGAKKEKIVYIPNGIPKEFFKIKKSAKEENKILFFSRISPKKKVETLVAAIPFIKNKEIKVEIVGPKEEEYFKKIKSMIGKLKVSERIKISEPIYDINEKIKKIDSSKVFVLPSRVEGMPQALIEAMSRGKIVIGSDSIAIRDLIQDGKNGYLFEFDNPKSLAEKIDVALENTKMNKEIRKNARVYVNQFSWDNVIKKIESLLK